MSLRLFFSPFNKKRVLGAIDKRQRTNHLSSTKMD